jgi:hypothetical protein
MTGLRLQGYEQYMHKVELSDVELNDDNDVVVALTFYKLRKVLSAASAQELGRFAAQIVAQGDHPQARWEHVYPLLKVF